MERLLGSLAVDSTLIREELGWSPPHAMQAGLATTAGWYRKAKTMEVSHMKRVLDVALALCAGAALLLPTLLVALLVRLTSPGLLLFPARLKIFLKVLGIITAAGGFAVLVRADDRTDEPPRIGSQL